MIKPLLLVMLFAGCQPGNQEADNTMKAKGMFDAFNRHDWAAMTHGRLVVALMDVRDWNPWLPDALALLDPAENERMLRRRRSGDREVLALAYGLHRLLLGHALGMDAAAVPLWRDASGRPRVGDDGIHTSLSHADTWVALAVSSAGPLGVDIEPLTRVDMLPEIAGSICHPQEAAALRGLAPDRRARGADPARRGDRALATRIGDPGDRRCQQGRGARRRDRAAGGLCVGAGRTVRAVGRAWRGAG